MLWNVNWGGLSVALTGPLVLILEHEFAEKLFLKKRDSFLFFTLIQSNPDSVKSPVHKPLQTAANNRSFIINWMCWIQLFYSCTYKNHYYGCGMSLSGECAKKSIWRLPRAAVWRRAGKSEAEDLNGAKWTKQITKSTKAIAWKQSTALPNPCAASL